MMPVAQIITDYCQISMLSTTPPQSYLHLLSHPLNACFRWPIDLSPLLIKSPQPYPTFLSLLLRLNVELHSSHVRIVPALP
jgi:hypothetical protein